MSGVLLVRQNPANTWMSPLSATVARNVPLSMLLFIDKDARGAVSWYSNLPVQIVSTVAFLRLLGR
jgi:hypothetical protein